MLANIVVRLLDSSRQSGQGRKMLVVVLCVLSLSTGDVFIERLHLYCEVGDLGVDDANCLVMDLACDGLNLRAVLVGSLEVLLVKATYVRWE